MSNSVFPATQVINFPAGMIMPYAGASVPAGWLECNGAEIDIALYPTLAAALGSTWNTAKNPLTGANYSAPAGGKFRVPDMRGAFLRGSSSGANNQNGVATALAEFQDQKTKKNGLSATSTAPAFTGSSATTPSGGTHTHRTYPLVGANSNTFYTWTAASTASGGSYGFGYGDHQVQSTDSGHTHTLTATGTNSAPTITVAAGDAETRPDSVGVRYLIKA